MLMKKTLQFLSHCYKQVIKNKFRLTLTTLGIAIASIILILGYIGIETYYQRDFNMYEVYKSRDVVLLSGELDNTKLEDIEKRLGSSYAAYINLKTTPLKSINYKNREVYIVGNFRGTTENFVKYPVPTNEKVNTLYSTSFIEGSSFTSEDIKNRNHVVIIDEELKSLLFGSSSAIGKEILIPRTEYVTEDGARVPIVKGYDSFTVKGVVSASSYSKSQSMKFLDKLEKDDLDFDYSVELYVPYSVAFSDTPAEELTTNKLIYQGVADKTAFFNVLSNGDKRDKTIQIFTYESIVKAIEYQSANMKKSLQFIGLVLLILSVVNISNTMFFSVKERINEIGIRKSIGASDIDIQIQFLVEAVIYAFIGFCIATIFSILIAFITTAYLRYIGYFDLKLEISLKTLGSILSLELILTIISSLIPAIYASKIKIADAIRFD